MARTLAAILAADVVGYSRLMEEDETATLASLQSHRREAFEPEIASRNGRVFKLMGDGLLADFASVVDAVECALAVQRRMAERNAGSSPDRRIDFRIAVNLGDVIMEGEDRYGEGVNIAARLQQFAEPGGIVISGSAYDQVKSKVGAACASLGDRQLKNIAEPVRLYRLALEAPARARAAHPPRRGVARWYRPAVATGLLLAALAAAAVAWMAPWTPDFHTRLPLPDKPSLVVLPFANLSADEAQGYFADGMTEDLTTALAQVSGLFVISRNSAFQYRGADVDLRQVAEDLGVRYVLEGSVQRSADALRINVQLVDATTGGHLWAERFDGKAADVFTLQDRVTRSIAEALAVRLTDADRQGLARQETSDPAAYDAFLHGWERLRRRTPDDFAAALPYLKEAVGRDPDYGRAYAALAWLYEEVYARRWAYALGIPRFRARDLAREYLEQAQKRPTALSHQVAGLLLRDNANVRGAVDEFKNAIALDSSDALSYAYLAETLAYAGRPSEAVTHVETALRLDPHYPAYFLYVLASAQFGLDRFADAAASLELAIARNPLEERALFLLASVLGRLGRKEEAAAMISRFDALRVERGGIPYALSEGVLWIYQSPKDKQRLIDGLVAAGVAQSLFEGRFAETNRVRGDALRALFLGHQLHGRTPQTDIEHAATITADGIATLTGDWGWITGASVGFEEHEVCYAAEDGVRFCGQVYRNPGGTREKENEYIWHESRGAMTFSQVE